MKRTFHTLSMLFVLFQALLQVNLYAMRDAEDDQPGSSSTQTSRTPEGQKRTFDSVSSTRSVVSHRNAGLKNGRNICYLNAVVQCLSNLKAFRSTLLGNKAFYQQYRIDDTPEDRAKKTLVLNLIKLFENLRTTDASAVEDKDFTDLAKKLIEDIPASQRMAYQDADEFLTLLLSQIHEPDRISLELQLDQKVKCLGFGGVCGCQHESQKHETHETIALPLHEIAIHNTLQSLLESFFTSSFAYDYVCGSCHNVNTSFKSSKILENHDELIITLKRFNSDGTKIINQVSFPMELDLKPYAASELKDRAGVNLLYELAGFVCHGDNHYVSLVKDFENGKWYVYNDSDVKEINVQGIPDITKAGTFALGYQIFTPYILFYQKKRLTAQAPDQPTAQQSGAESESRGFNPTDDDADLPEPSSQNRKGVVDLQDPETAANMAGTLPSMQQSKDTVPNNPQVTTNSETSTHQAQSTQAQSRGNFDIEEHIKKISSVRDLYIDKLTQFTNLSFNDLFSNINSTKNDLSMELIEQRIIEYSKKSDFFNIYEDPKINETCLKYISDIIQIKRASLINANSITLNS